MQRAADLVNHPPHYTEGAIECIDALKASMTTDAFHGLLKGQVIKYMWRYEKKFSPVEDLKKAQWYLTRLIEETSNADSRAVRKDTKTVASSKRALNNRGRVKNKPRV